MQNTKKTYICNLPATMLGFVFVLFYFCNKYLLLPKTYKHSQKVVKSYYAKGWFVLNDKLFFKKIEFMELWRGRHGLKRIHDELSNLYSLKLNFLVQFKKVKQNENCFKKLKKTFWKILNYIFI